MTHFSFISLILLLIPLNAQPASPPALSSEYSFGFWENSWRKNKGETFQDLLCLETDSYGMKVNIQNLPSLQLGSINKAPGSLRSTLSTGVSRLKDLPPAALTLEVEHAGERYQLVGCQAGESGAKNRLQSVRLWESGTIAQHYDIQGLILKNKKGETLISDATLDLVAWPDSVTLTGKISPAHNYKHGLTEGLHGAGMAVISDQYVIPESEIPAPERFTVELWTKLPEAVIDRPSGWLLCNKRHESEDGNFGFLAHHNHFSAHLNIGGKKGERRRIKSSGYLSRKKWHQLVLSYDGTHMRFYLDGSFQGQEEINLPRNSGTERFSLGKRGDGLGSLCKGLYDQIRMWNRPLSHQEVKTLYKKSADAPPAKGLLFNHSFGNNYVPPVWKDVKMSLGLNSAEIKVKEENIFKGEWKVGESQQLTVTHNFRNPVQNPALSLNLKTADGKVTPLEYNAAFNSYSTILKRSSFLKSRGLEIRDYDEYLITLENKGNTSARVPVYLDLRNPAGITGLVPQLCYKDGTPTGIPVQLSKNWHFKDTGSYLRPYMILPVSAESTITYKLRVIYGFYGNLPSASHAQLSLVGYANNSRWDQLAIGCFGETICFDMDTACVPNVITDVRGLMLRSGEQGKKWGWTDCTWGGDWMRVGIGENKEADRLYFNVYKTAYLAHGPCLTDARYDGSLGVNHEVKMEAQIMTTRSDDFARTFQNLSYTFKTAHPAERVTLFTVGGRTPAHTKSYAFGDKNGIHKEGKVSVNREKGDYTIKKHTLGGEGPWWISLPDSTPITRDGRNWGTGNRGLIVRKYEATFSGKTYTHPTLSLPISHDLGKGEKTLQIQLTPPAEVTQIQPGDTIKMDLEMVTMPRVAEDYYGPNAHFRNGLKHHPNSWFPLFWETTANDLEVTVSGGTLKNNYPLLIQQAPDSPLKFSIKGGAGAIPLRLENVINPHQKHLYQIKNGVEERFSPEVHGKDFRQIDYIAQSHNYHVVYNIPLDGVPLSHWVFK